ncbi:hypothetical protein BDW62DRAFT_95271 [Aspergillus aurantiobrunneus]
MDSVFQPFVQGPGFQNAAVSGASLPSDYIDPTQPFDPASLYEYVPSNGQSLSMPPYNETYGSNGVVPNMDDGSSGYSTLPPMTDLTFANMSTNMSNQFDALSTIPAESGNFGDIPRQWSNFTQTQTGPPMTNSAPRYAYYPSTVTHSSAAAQTSMFTSPIRFLEIPDIPDVQNVPNVQSVPQPHPSQNPFPHGQVMMSAGAPTTNSGTGFRQSRNTPTFPQSGVSAGSAHQRRNQRAASFAPVSTVSAHHRVRSSTHSSRGRTRPTSMTATTTHTNAPPTQQPMTQSQRSHASATTAPPTRPTERPEYQTTQYQPSADRVSENNELHELLRNLNPSEFRALYETHLARSSRINPSYFIQQSARKKLLDSPQKSRPEPKETDELTINMECKICMGQLVDTVLLPCGHATLCRWCADEHIPSHNGYPRGKASCPLCREPVRQKHRIYFP